MYFSSLYYKEILHICLINFSITLYSIYIFSFRKISACVEKDEGPSTGIGIRMNSVSECGVAILVSLNHFCGNAGLSQGKGRKCNSGKKTKPNLQNFCKTKGSNQDLIKALENLIKEHIKEGVVKQGHINRIKKELVFLKKCIQENP